MNTIVTGATGGLGRNLVEALLARGDEVLALGRNQSIGGQLNTPFTSCELSDTASVLTAFESADIVFHCAALSSPWGKKADFQMANVEATKNILHAMEVYEIEKIVFVSTSSVYFDFCDRINISEFFVPKTFVNHYAQSKFEAEQLVLNSSFHTVVIRPRGIFGKYDQVLIPRLLRVSEKGSIPLSKRSGKVAGSARVDVTYVGNVVQALLLCTNTDVPSRSVFNISNQSPMTISDIYRLVNDTLGCSFSYRSVPYSALYSVAMAMEYAAHLRVTGEPLLTRYSLGLISYDQTLDNTKAQQVLGYYPHYTIEEGLAHYATSL